MLIRLTAEQVVREWEVVKHAMHATAYEKVYDDPEKVRDYLRELIVGTMQVWAIVEAEEFVGFLSTRFSNDATIGARRLEIYSLFGFRDVGLKTWAACYVILKRFALANNCKHIMAITDQEAIIKLAKRFKADTSQTLIVFDL